MLPTPHSFRDCPSTDRTPCRGRRPVSAVGGFAAFGGGVPLRVLGGPFLPSTDRPRAIPCGASTIPCAALHRVSSISLVWDMALDHLSGPADSPCWYPARKQCACTGQWSMCASRSLSWNNYSDRCLSAFAFCFGNIPAFPAAFLTCAFYHPTLF